LRSLPDQKEKPGADPTVQAPDEQSYYLYNVEGFSFMENLAANAILRQSTSDKDASIATVHMPFKNDVVKQDFFPLVLMPSLSFFVQLMFIPFLYRTVSSVVSEKSNRSRESMRMMGMSDVAYWVSWLIYWTLINTTIATLSTLILIINVF
jgi:ABC-type multidrug transport system permease subunit